MTETTKELLAENQRLRMAIDYYEVGVAAVGEQHPTKAAILRDCIKEARALWEEKPDSGLPRRCEGEMQDGSCDICGESE